MNSIFVPISYLLHVSILQYPKKGYLEYPMGGGKVPHGVLNDALGVHNT